MAGIILLPGVYFNILNNIVWVEAREHAHVLFYLVYIRRFDDSAVLHFIYVNSYELHLKG